MPPSRTHLVLIPSYNTGPGLLLDTVRRALAAWSPVWVVLDGSTDGSAAALAGLDDSDLRVLALPRNAGKGAAVLHGLAAADQAGFSHALVMDADGQHPADRIARFMAASAARPDAMILGQPIFGADAPILRVLWRRLSNACVALETLGAGVGDSLFGFRVYPVRPLLEELRASRWMRRFDFDAEAAVRLCWRGIGCVQQKVPVRYLQRDEGGVSHFRYARDNLLLGSMHARLLFGLLRRWPQILRYRHDPVRSRSRGKSSLTSVLYSPRQHAPGSRMDGTPQRPGLPQPETSSSQASGPGSPQTEAEQKLAMLMVTALQLDIAPEQIDPEAPLFDKGLGLDSIDALELALAVSRNYGVKLRSDDAQKFRIFASLRNLSAHIQSVHSAKATP